MAGQGQARGIGVDRDDLPGAGENRAQQPVQANPAEADHGDRIAGLQAGGIDHRPDPGHHRAAKDGGLVEGDIAVHLDRRAAIDDRVFSETRNTGMVGDHRACRITQAAAAAH